MTHHEIRSRAARLERRLGARNRRETLGAIVVLGWLVLLATGSQTNSLMQGSLLWAALSILVICVIFGTHGRPAQLVHHEPDILKQALAKELKRHATLLFWAPFWYVLPLALGAAGFLVGLTTLHGQQFPSDIALALVAACGALSAVDVHTARRMWEEAERIEQL